MGRLFFIFIIIIIANFVKKVLEAAKQSQQDQAPSGPDVKESIDNFLNQDEFLKAFQQKAQPVQEKKNLLENIAGKWQGNKDTSSDRVSEKAGYVEFKPINFQDERDLAVLKDQEDIAFKAKTKEEGDIKIDLSSENIQSAFVLKEILSPPVSIRPHDEGFLG